MYEFWLIAHFVGLTLLAAGVGVTNLSGIMAAKTTDPRMIVMWSRLNFKGEHIAILPGALLLLIAGTALVHEVGYDFGALWISAAYALWLVAVFLGAGVLGRHAKRMRRAAEAEIEQGVEVSVEAARIARSPIGPIFGNVLNLILLVFLYLMVAKPT